MRRALKFVPTLLLILLFSCVSLLAQNRGIITGLVTDPTGATVGGATITITNQATDVRTVVKSTLTGDYTAPVPAGVYRVETAVPGFKTAVWSDVRVGVLQSVTLNMQLQLGTVTEQVSVTARPPLLNTVSGTLSTNVTPREYADLPLFVSSGMRGATLFMALLPGVNSDTGTGGGTFYVNGGEGRSGELQLDGVSASTQQFLGDTRGFQVPVDTIQEFTVLTNSFSAEFGRTGGGIQSFALKSGTNQLHGEVYEFARNFAFDARGFYAKSVPVTRQHEFGGNLGGPITFPRVYHGKDRSFFFVDYTGYRYNTAGTNYLTTIPTAKMRQGDFSEIVDSKGAMIPIYDPDTTTQGAGGVLSRTPFSGNIIPSARFSPLALKVQKYLPPPNRSGFVNNYISSDANTNRQDNGTVRLDHTISDKHKLNGSFVINYWNTTNPAALPYPIGGKNGQNLNSRIFRLSHDWMISPNMINHLNLAYNRLNTATLYMANGVDWSDQLGLIGGQHSLRGFPSFSTGRGSFGGGGWVANFDNTYNVLDNFAWQHGKHAIKFGGELRFMQTNMINAGGEPGFSFGNGPTCKPTTADCQFTGDSYASFLLGLASGSQLYISPTMFGGRWRYYVMYAQDDWKVTRKLTLNLGFRYEIPIPYHEAHNRISNVDLNTPNPGAGNILGALVFLPDIYKKTGRRSFYDTDLHDFGPRVGIAYQLPWNAVLHTGYGIYYGALSTLGNGGMGANMGIGTRGWSSYPQFPATSAYTWDTNIDTQGWQTNRYTPPPFFDPSYANGGLASAVFPYSGRAPYTQNWNFGFQKQTKGDILFDFSYAGSKGTRLATGRSIYAPKEMPPQYWYLSASPLIGLNIYNSAVVAAGFKPPYPGFNGSLAQALAPWPQYTRLTYTLNDANSTYHAFQFKAQKKFSNGISFLISYTLSKTIADGFSAYNRQGVNLDGRDEYHKYLDKMLSWYDRTHVASIAFLYELPFGRGKRFGGNSGRLADAFVGGWQLNGVLSYASGQALPITGPATISNVIARTYTPNPVPGVPQVLWHGGKWDPATSVFLNRAAWSMPPLGTLGYSNYMLSNVRWFPSMNENLGLFKNVSLTERAKLQLRWEVNNVGNRFLPSNPNSGWNPTSTIFGKTTGQANTPRFMQIAAKLMF